MAKDRRPAMGKIGYLTSDEVLCSAGIGENLLIPELNRSIRERSFVPWSIR